MKLRFSPRTVSDLTGIADYIKAESPSGSQRVRAAILDSLNRLVEFPRIGCGQEVQGVRKLVTRKYRYLVYYTVDEIIGEIVVLTIQHPSRELHFADE